MQAAGMPNKPIGFLLQPRRLVNNFLNVGFSLNSEVWGVEGRQAVLLSGESESFHWGSTLEPDVEMQRFYLDDLGILFSLVGSRKCKRSEYLLWKH